MDAKSAWERFQSTGMITDYLNYRSIENGLLPYCTWDSESNSRGTNNEIRCDGNNSKRKGLE